MKSSPSINCIIIDDEKLARDLLESMVNEEADLCLLAKCRSTSEAKLILKAQRVDLIFLDIQMPSQTGLAFLREVKPDALIILVTAFPDFALEGFDLEVADYLLKPVIENRFKLAVSRVRNELTRRTKAQAFDALDHSTTEFITVKTGHNEFKVDLDDIDYIESQGEYVRIHTSSKAYMTLGALKVLEAELPSGSFQRIHRSYLVPIAKVHGRTSNHLQLLNGKLLPIGRTYRTGVGELF